MYAPDIGFLGDHVRSNMWYYTSGADGQDVGGTDNFLARCHELPSAWGIPQGPSWACNGELNPLRSISSFLRDCHVHRSLTSQIQTLRLTDIGRPVSLTKYRRISLN
jgi:hypothetical protein